MEKLLAEELISTEQFETFPTEENKLKLIAVKKKIIQELNVTGSESVKKICKGYYNECYENLINQYDYFHNLLNYLEDKEDVSSILKIINETSEQIKQF
jgi:hypothetical protein